MKECENNFYVIFDSRCEVCWNAFWVNFRQEVLQNPDTKRDFSKNLYDYAYQLRNISDYHRHIFTMIDQLKEELEKEGVKFIIF